jgi:hypothetical protein
VPPGTPPATELAIQIIDNVYLHGRVTMVGMVRATGTSSNTLKDHFRSLVEKGHLSIVHPAGIEEHHVLQQQCSHETSLGARLSDSFVLAAVAQNVMMSVSHHPTGRTPALFAAN